MVVDVVVQNPQKVTSTNMRKNISYVVTPRCAAAAVVSAVVLLRPTKEYTHPYSMMHRRSAYCRYWGLASLSPITSITTMRCDIDCASSFNLAKSTKYDSKTNEKKKNVFSIYESSGWRAQSNSQNVLTGKITRNPGNPGGVISKRPRVNQWIFQPFGLPAWQKKSVPPYGGMSCVHPVCFI